MARVIGWLVLCASLSQGGACWAQTPAPGLPAIRPPATRPPATPLPAPQALPAPRQAQVTAARRQPPAFSVVGVPAHIDAPVSPPYAGTAYHTLAGQPETGADAIAGQVMQPDDASPR